MTQNMFVFNTLLLLILLASSCSNSSIDVQESEPLSEKKEFDISPDTICLSGEKVHLSGKRCLSRKVYEANMGTDKVKLFIESLNYENESKVFKINLYQKNGTFLTIVLDDHNVRHWYVTSNWDLYNDPLRLDLEKYTLFKNFRKIKETGYEPGGKILNEYFEEQQEIKEWYEKN